MIVNVKILFYKSDCTWSKIQVVVALCEFILKITFLCHARFFLLSAEQNFSGETESRLCQVAGKFSDQEIGVAVKNGKVTGQTMGVSEGKGGVTEGKGGVAEGKGGIAEGKKSRVQSSARQACQAGSQGEAAPVWKTN